MPAGKLREQAARGVFWTAAQTLGSRLISILVFVALARLLEPSAFGTVALATVAVALMTVFVDQGFGQALVQRKDLRKGHEDTAFWISLAAGCSLAIVLVASAGPVADLLGDAAFGPVLRTLSLVLPITALSSVPQALFYRELAFRFLAERAVVAALVGGATGVTAALLGAEAWSLVAQTVVTAGVGSALLWLRSPYRPGLQVSRECFEDLFGFGLRIQGTEFFNFINRNADNLLIGAVLGPVALGFYTVGYKILLMMTEVLMRTIESVGFPVFAKVNDDVGRLRAGFLKATQLCCVIALPTFCLVGVLAPQMIETVFGTKWLATVPVMEALAAAGAIQSVVYFASSVLLAMGRASSVFRITAFGALANVAAFAISVHWGIVAVAISYAVRAWLFAPIWIQAARRGLDFRWSEFARIILPTMLATSIAGLVTLALRDPTAARMQAPAALVVLGGVGLVVYLLSFRLLAPSTSTEFVKLVRAGLPSLRPKSRAASDLGRVG